MGTKGKARYCDMTKTRKERKKNPPSVRQLVREALAPKKDDTK